MTEEELVSRFRPNLVVSGNGIEPYSEDQWNDVIIGDQKFQVSILFSHRALCVGTNDVQVVGKCSRCRTVCVDQRTGLKSSEPLQTLMELRGSRVSPLHTATSSTHHIYSWSLSTPPPSTNLDSFYCAKGVQIRHISTVH